MMEAGAGGGDGSSYSDCSYLVDIGIAAAIDILYTERGEMQRIKQCVLHISRSKWGESKENANHGRKSCCFERTVPSRNVIFCYGDRVEWTEKPMIKTLSDPLRIAEILV